MRIYILCDMEGISGIRYMEQVMPSEAAYEEGRQLMMAEINAAVAGCFEGGATEVVVCDTHGGGGQIRLEHMDPRAIYERPALGRLMPSLEAGFAGVILLGHHAMAGTQGAFLDHTMCSRTWFQYRLNGQPLGEIGIEAAYAGHYGVPVIMVSGDQATADEAHATLGEVDTAVVKWGLGRNRAKCIAPPAAREIVKQCAAGAVQGARQIKPFKPKLPATVELTLYRSDFCEDYSCKPGIERVDARTIRMKSDSLLRLLP